MKIIIAEKASVARTIKSALQNDQYTYLSVAGHISRIDYTKSRNKSWARTDLRQLVIEDYKYEYVDKFSLKQLKKLKRDLVLDELILAMDPDVEGFHIRNTVLDYLDSKNISARVISEMTLEALSVEAIRKAYASRKTPEISKGYPGDLRMRLDFLFGTILTRKATLDFQKKYRAWSIYKTGRVQTPTLNEITLRQQQIEKFKPEVYFELSARVKNTHYDILLDKLDKAFVTKPRILQLRQIDVTNKIVPARTGLNTDEFLKLLARKHAAYAKITPAVTKILNEAYLKGLISYPRVENNSYANHQDLLDLFAKNYELMTSKRSVVLYLKPSNAITDHGPITPLVLPDRNRHSIHELRILQSLYDHGAKMFSGPNTYKVHRYLLRTETKQYEFSVVVALNVNYDDGSKFLKTLEQPLSLDELNLETKQTQPKSRYTTSSLIGLMTKRNLGTKSTKAQIIQNLVDSKYVVYDKNKLKPTVRGRNVIQYWRTCFKTITQAELTAEIESCFRNLDSAASVHETEQRYRKFLKDTLLNY